MLGTAGARLKDELRQFKLESQKLLEQFLETETLIVSAWSQRGNLQEAS